MAHKVRNTVIPAVFLVLKRKNEVLLQRRFNTGFQDGQYTLPSGHVEKNESPAQAICREVKEEAGVTVKPEDVTFEQVLYRPGYNAKGTDFDLAQSERVDFIFSTQKWEGEPFICEPEKCDDLRWFPLNELPENMFSVVKNFFKSDFKHVQYVEAGYI